MTEDETIAALRFTMLEVYLRCTNIAASHCAHHAANAVVNHSGQYETCPHSLCRFTRETLALLKGEEND
jgi:hypothetical protein